MKFCNNFDFLKETDNSLDMLDGANPKTEVFSGYLSRNKDISSVFFLQIISTKLVTGRGLYFFLKK